jgi:hypothetical protein
MQNISDGIFHVASGSMLTLLCWSVALIPIIVGIYILATVVVTTHCSLQQKLYICVKKTRIILQIFNANNQMNDIPMFMHSRSNRGTMGYITILKLKNVCK